MLCVQIFNILILIQINRTLQEHLINSKDKNLNTGKKTKTIHKELWLY